MFDALDHKDGSAVLRQSLIFLVQAPNAGGHLITLYYRRCNRMRTMRRTDIDESFSVGKAEHE